MKIDSLYEEIQKKYYDSTRDPKIAKQPQEAKNDSKLDKHKKWEKRHCLEKKKFSIWILMIKKQFSGWYKSETHYKGDR